MVCLDDVRPELTRTGILQCCWREVSYIRPFAPVPRQQPTFSPWFSPRPSRVTSTAAVAAPTYRSGPVQSDLFHTCFSAQGKR
jgi:hypothetical protein